MVYIVHAKSPSIEKKKTNDNATRRINTYSRPNAFKTLITSTNVYPSAIKMTIKHSVIRDFM